MAGDIVRVSALVSLRVQLHQLILRTRLRLCDLDLI